MLYIGSLKKKKADFPRLFNQLSLSGIRLIIILYDLSSGKEISNKRFTEHMLC